MITPFKEKTKLQKQEHITTRAFVISSAIFMLSVLLFLSHGSASTKEQNNVSNITLTKEEIIELKKIAFTPFHLKNAAVRVTAESKKISYTGSGTIIKSDYKGTIILTVAHLIPPSFYTPQLNADGFKLQVIYGYDFKKAEAELLRIDPRNDIAILRILRMNIGVTVPIAQSQITEGDTVWTISNPLDKYRLINKGVLAETSFDINTFSTGGVFGSSGGMILNTKGELIGIIATVSYAEVPFKDSSIPSLTIYNNSPKLSMIKKLIKDVI